VSDIPTFGERVPGQEYVDRPSAYVILRDGSRIAIVRTPLATYLPGGGQDPGESPERAALREVAEECGLQAVLVDKLGVANQYVYSVEEGKFFMKGSTFFRARVIGTAIATEPDHETLWVTPEEAQRELSHESHRWAVTEEHVRRGT
jgi:8-oxo-dGTP diphosphatase